MKIEVETNFTKSRREILGKPYYYYKSEGWI